MDNGLAKIHLSVDCAVLGFNGTRLEVLLIRRTGIEDGQAFHDMKLPGSLILDNEELDDAARRVLAELTGLKNIPLVQFQSFGSINRTKDPKDVHWLEHAQKAHVHRIVTVAYMALVDHNDIIAHALEHLRALASMDPSILYDLLPRKFTVTQLRNLYEVVFGKRLDPANFYKKMTQMPYLVALDEREKGVSHRAARFYRFDKNIYNKSRL